MTYNQLLENYKTAQFSHHTIRQALNKTILIYNKNARKHNLKVLNPLDLLKNTVPTYYDFIVDLINNIDGGVNRFLKTIKYTNLFVSELYYYLRTNTTSFKTVEDFYLTNNLPLYLCGMVINRVSITSQWGSHFSYTLIDPINNKVTSIYSVSDFLLSFIEHP